MKRLSISEVTTPDWSFREDVENYREHGIPGIGVWYHKIRDMGVGEVKETLGNSGLRVSSLLQAGFFTLDRKKMEELSFCIPEMTTAIELAHAIGAEALEIITGPPDLAKGGIEETEELTIRSLKEIAPLAEELNVRIALEPLHPMYLDTWSSIVTIEQAMDIIDEVGSGNIGICLDVYHVYWDPKLYEGIKRATGRVFGVHIDDWRFPTRNFEDRVIMGDGILPLATMLRAIEDTGYTGCYEVELFSEELEKIDHNTLLERIKDAYNSIPNGETPWVSR
jgi:sugar phosphate isomerase/epimerase